MVVSASADARQMSAASSGVHSVNNLKALNTADCTHKLVVNKNLLYWLRKRDGTVNIKTHGNCKRSQLRWAISDITSIATTWMDPINGILQAFDYFQVTPEGFFHALLTSTSVAAHPTSTITVIADDEICQPLYREFEPLVVFVPSKYLSYVCSLINNREGSYSRYERLVLGAWNEPTSLGHFLLLVCSRRHLLYKLRGVGQYSNPDRLNPHD